MSTLVDTSFVLPPPYSGELPAHVGGLALSPDGTKLAALYEVRNSPERGEMRLRIWDLGTRKHQNLELPGGRFEGLCWPREELLVLGSYGRVVLLPTQGGASRELKAPRNSIGSAIASRPGGKELVVFQGSVGLIDLDSGATRQGEHKTWEMPVGVVLHPGGDLAATRAAESYLRIFSIGKGVQLHRISAGAASAFSPDGERLVYGPTQDGTLQEVRIDGDKLKPLRELPGAVNTGDLAFSPDGALLVGTISAGRSSSGLRVWDMGSGSLRSERRWADERLSHPLFTPDGAWLLGATLFGGEIGVWARGSL